MVLELPMQTGARSLLSTSLNDLSMKSHSRERENATISALTAVIPRREEQTKTVHTVADAGLVLMDASLTPIAFDRGAAAILGDSHESGKTSLGIPESILDALRSFRPADLSSVKMHFRTAGGKYVLRAYLVEIQNDGSKQPVVALHLQKASSAEDAVHEVGPAYHLTQREQEALIGILSGLSSKELAARMKISPNTVRAYMRLIMVKMGVESRAEVVAKLLL